MWVLLHAETKKSFSGREHIAPPPPPRNHHARDISNQAQALRWELQKISRVVVVVGGGGGAPFSGKTSEIQRIDPQIFVLSQDRLPRNCRPALVEQRCVFAVHIRSIWRSRDRHRALSAIRKAISVSQQCCTYYPATPASYV